MPIDTEGYRDFSLSFSEDDVQFAQVVDVGIDPSRNGGATVMSIYTGVLRLAVQGTSQQWTRGVITLRIPTGGRRWTSISRGRGWTYFRDGAAVLSLAAIFNQKVANNAGWEIDGAIVEPRIIAAAATPRDHLSLQARLGVRDSDGFLQGLSYQVTAKGLFRPDYPTIDPGDLEGLELTNTP